MNKTELMRKRCKPCEGDVPPLTMPQSEEYLKQARGWTLEGKRITKKFTFKNFKETMKFVNKVADLAEREGHHPDMEVSYGYVIINLTTHAINGLSENDFILAVKINQLNF